MAEKPPLPPEEVRRILRELVPLSEDRRIILVGGQAVAFWAVFFELTTPPAEWELFTSKDIDFEGAARSARKAGELLHGDVRIPTLDDHTPNTGVVVFKDSDGEVREADFISAPYGLDGRDVRDSAVKLNVSNADQSEVPVWVLHPERCMESRVYNVVGLRQTGRIRWTSSADPWSVPGSSRAFCSMTRARPSRSEYEPSCASTSGSTASA